MRNLIKIKNNIGCSYYKFQKLMQQEDWKLYDLQLERGLKNEE